MEWRDQADLGRAVEACENKLRKAFVQVTDRGPVGFAMATVDLADQAAELDLKFTVGANVAPRRAGDLPQRYAAFQAWLDLQHAVEGAHPVGYTLRVIQPV